VDIKKMKQEMEEELVSNILPFWINRMTDEVNGGSTFSASVSTAVSRAGRR
jgi:mannose/cellobiose epimerase-like protein (N-acyl-D-glucosamine 2-epimerase family)